jgi:LmbE family N-acetylglucosaminyl deacetylase
MKLRLFDKPASAVALLGLAALLLGAATLASGWPYALIILPFALFYLLLFLCAGMALTRLSVLEQWIDWSAPQRLLILAPHEDDCVIAAGGIGARNRAVGGATRVAYLAPDEAPGMAERRADEAHAAWREAGVEGIDLQHLDLLPKLRQRDPAKLLAAARQLRVLIEDFHPTVIVMPMFEGGHIHHDMVARLIGSIVAPSDSFAIFEAPEYGPYVSLRFTPHRVIALCARWLGVSYYGPPDGIDGRSVLKVRLTPSELACKRRMLAAFVSQNAPSLVATRAYPDRLVRWQPSAIRRFPFERAGSYLAVAQAALRVMPQALVDRLLPGPRGTLGREPRLTDWDDEIAQGPNLSTRST